MTNNEIANQIKKLSLNILARSVHDVTFSEYTKDDAHSMAIYQAGIGAELLIKAKLISINPNLVFVKFPEEVNRLDDLIISDYKTIQFSELLRVLSSVVKFKSDYEVEFTKFIKLRNLSLHLGYNNIKVNAQFEVLHFVFECLIPLMYEVDYFNECEFVNIMSLWDEVMISDAYLVGVLQEQKINTSEKLMKELLKYNNEH